MIVAPPQEQVVKSPLKPQPKPILKPPTHAVQEDSIAARLKARRAQQPSGTNITKADDESIAERLLRRKRQLNQTQAAFPPSTLRQDNYLNTDSCYATPSSKRPGTYQQQMSLAADLSNFYLCTPMPRPEFGRVKLSDIPEEIIEEYKLRELATKDEWVYFRADKTHYGLPQAGSLSHDLLEKRLNAEGYVKTLTVPGLWKHKTRNIQFVLVVDDFGIKYVKKEDLDHLVGVLKRYYDVSVDIHGKEFVKIDTKEKTRLPYPHTEPKYGAKVQFAEYDDSPDVGKEGQTHIQRVNGKFLWYGRAVDPTTLVPLSALASQQSKPTQNTMNKSQHFLDYMATQQPAVLTYRKSDMILAVHSDAGYLNEENARSRVGGHHFLSEDVPLPPNNGAIHNVAEIIKAVMSSAAEAETGALYINASKGSRGTKYFTGTGPQTTAHAHTNR
eukprot:CCRYP_008425-RA/>CCRYP_008425-RA protein AED:0.37 eAED:0.37 QI:0/0/0/1/1/1/3/0/442